MLVVGLVGLPSARVEAVEKAGNDPMAQPVQIAGAVAGIASTAAAAIPAFSTALIAVLGPYGVAALAAVALAAALYNLFSCLGSIGGRKCSTATIAMSAVAVGLAGFGFAQQMDATSWFGTGEFMTLGTPRAELLPQQIAAAQAAGDTARAANLTAELRTLQPNATVLNGPGPVVSQPLGPVSSPVTSPGPAGGPTSEMVRVSNLSGDQLNALSLDAYRSGGGTYQALAPQVQVAVPQYPGAVIIGGGEIYGPVAPTTAGAQPAQAGAGVRVAGPVTGPTVPPAGQPVQPIQPPTRSTMDSFLQYVPLASLGLGLAGQVGALTGGSGSSGSGSSSADTRRAAEEQERRNREAAAAQEEANRRSALAQEEENKRITAEIKAEQERVAAEIKAAQDEVRKEANKQAAELNKQSAGTTVGGTSTGTGGVLTQNNTVTGEAVTQLELNQNVLKGGCEDGARARVGNTARPFVRFIVDSATQVQYDAGFAAGLAGQACE